MPAFPFELVSPEKIVFSGEVEAVVVPGIEGEFTVLKDHAPTLALMKPGILEYDLSTSAEDAGCSCAAALRRSRRKA